MEIDFKTGFPNGKTGMPLEYTTLIEMDEEEKDFRRRVMEEMQLEECSAIMSSQSSNDFTKEVDEYLALQNQLAEKESIRRRWKERISCALQLVQSKRRLDLLRREFAQHHNEVKILLESQPECGQPSSLMDAPDVKPMDDLIMNRVSGVFNHSLIFQQIFLSPSNYTTKSGTTGSFHFVSLSLGNSGESHIIVSRSVL